MIGFKGFDKNFKCRGFQYEVGQTYEHNGRIKLCESGFHFCKTMAQVFGYYGGTDKRYAEVEALGEVREGDDKCVTNKIRIIREIPQDEAVRMSNTGNWNTGNCNTGNWNTGNWNTGDRNTGDRNTGNWNTGDRNTGNRNTGDRNTGNCNTGNWNTGDRNTGNWNTGDRNTGNCNTGDRNTGNWNTGDWNCIEASSGCFNTIPQKITLFNKPSEWTIRDWWNSDARYILIQMPQEIDVIDWIPYYHMTDEEKEANPTYKITGGFLKVSKSNADKQAWWDELPDDKKETIKALPNFDVDVFRECTGIEVLKA